MTRHRAFQSLLFGDPKLELGRTFCDQSQILWKWKKCVSPESYKFAVTVLNMWYSNDDSSTLLAAPATPRPQNCCYPQKIFVRLDLVSNLASENPGWSRSTFCRKRRCSDINVRQRYDCLYTLRSGFQTGGSLLVLRRTGRWRTYRRFWALFCSTPGSVYQQLCHQDGGRWNRRRWYLERNDQIVKS